MQDVLSARPIRIERTDYGYLRVWTFDVEDDGAFLQGGATIRPVAAERTDHRPAEPSWRIELGSRTHAAVAHAGDRLADAVQLADFTNDAVDGAQCV
jgi:hypothetical protein